MGWITAFNLTYDYLKQNIKNENVFAVKQMFPENVRIENSKNINNVFVTEMTCEVLEFKKALQFF